MKRKDYVRVALVLLFATFLFGQKVTCTASKTNFSLQEQVQLIFTFENIKNSPRNIDLKLHDVFSIVGGPYSSSNYSWVNGKSTSTATVTYDLMPLKTGKIMIPAYEFKIKNQVYTTEPFFVNISKDIVSESNQKTMPTVFIETNVLKKDIYQGETFTVTYQLYTSENVVNYTTSPLNTLNGFIVDNFELNSSPRSSKKIINGKEYLLAELATLTLTPTEVGEMVIPPKPFRISLAQQGKSRTFFDDPFFGSSSKDVNIIAPSDTLKIMPLPLAAGPAFSGAIGEFSLSVGMDSTIIQENQATALKIKLRGHGNMQHFTFPEQKFAKVFEVFAPKVKDNYKLKDQDYAGERTWEYVLIPSDAGTYTFEDIKFTFFSPELKKYLTLYASVPDLRVLSYNELEGDYSAVLTPEEVRLLSKDIRFIQMDEKKVIDSGHDTVKDFKNWIFYYLSILLVLFFVGLELFERYRQQNILQIRYKNSLKTFKNEFQKITENGKPEEILHLIESAFYNYLEDKQIIQEDYPRIKDIIKTIETYKYAPGMLSHVQLTELKDQALEIIEEMEKV